MDARTITAATETTLEDSSAEFATADGGLKGAKVIVTRKSDGLTGEASITGNEKTQLQVKKWPKDFSPSAGDTYVIYFPIPSARVGLCTIVFTLVAFFAGSLLFPDRKKGELT